VIRGFRAFCFATAMPSVAMVKKDPKIDGARRYKVFMRT
jgi:hypothetical protein